MQIEVFHKNDVQDISADLLENGKLKLLPASYYKSKGWGDFRTFCHAHGRYGIPTYELVEYLQEVIDARTALEIGAGAGDLGYHLQITMTDNKQQERPDIAAKYKLMRQPVIKYPKDVEKIDALDAVIKYKPQVVVASWITPYSPVEVSWGSNPHGIKEPEILDLVETLIIIGNLDTHWDKPIMKYKHEELFFDWLVSRGKNQSNNRIFIWNK